MIQVHLSFPESRITLSPITTIEGLSGQISDLTKQLVSANADLIPGAAIRLNLLRREAVLHSADDPLPPDPPLSHLLAQLSLQDLQDALKPVRLGAALKKSSGAMGASGD